MKCFFITIIVSLSCTFELFAQNTDFVLAYEIENNTDTCLLKIQNITTDTLFLFNSYLNADFYTSKWLHRFSYKTKKHKLSFLPLLPYLSLHFSDKIILGENRLINKFQVLYQFKAIPPKETIIVAIPVNAFYTNEYIKDFNIKDYSIFHDRINFKAAKFKKYNSLIVELAIYKNIELLVSDSLFYKNEYLTNKQALSYQILSIPIKLETKLSIKKTTKLETPFVSVVKLIDAEQALNIEKAKQYIDVVQVYTKLGSKNPEEDWKKSIRFNYNLGQDRKFSNNFGYVHYDIEETIKGNYASVCFYAKEDDIKNIRYCLEKRGEKWVVVSIDYFD